VTVVGVQVEGGVVGGSGTAGVGGIGGVIRGRGGTGKVGVVIGCEIFGGTGIGGTGKVIVDSVICERVM
jgi:hypothetical protein